MPKNKTRTQWKQKAAELALEVHELRQQVERSQSQSMEAESLRRQLAESKAEAMKLRRMVESLAERVAGQSELLSRRAEGQ